MNIIKSMNYIYGASGHGKVLLDSLVQSGVVIDGFIDDDSSKISFMNLPVISKSNIKDLDIIYCGIGSTIVRRDIFSKMLINWQPHISIFSVVSDNSIIGNGSVVLHGAVVQSGSTVGRFVIINTNASVDHDCRIDDFVHIAPGVTICGDVSVGSGSWIGAGAVVIQGVTIGKDVTVGAGTVVISDIPDGVTVVGNPARIIKR